ncbi:TonB-dependent receptor domain-containing protein [Qipengyuania sp. MTN3-11]|uniref:TonB-dependent receptor domain-containing protein n=1 Tax=Qipengyuania sp. MTN3-11 TaxID=3056557 RepID=UPI0036F1A138
MHWQTTAVRAALSTSVAAIALLAGAPVAAQSGGTVGDVEEDADVEETANETIVVTGSRISRDGFDQPTPTTVLGSTEIRQAAKVNLQQVLNEQPQVRNTVSPTGTIGNTASGTAPVDLRGLGSARTLTLLNGRRFVGDNNLNFVPTSLVDRIEIVTGGASAAWGSDAVAGVVNIILDDDFDGLTIGASAGISSRHDGERYGVDGAFGTSFADGRGHFIIGAEYVDDSGIPMSGRRDRPRLGAGLVAIGGGQVELQPDVNTDLFPISQGGTILSGSLAGQAFNSDGTLGPYTLADASSLYDSLIVASPLERFSSYARATFDITNNIEVWVDGAYGISDVRQPFFADPAGSILAFQVATSNPFLNPGVRAQLLGAGEAAFVLGRFSTDSFVLDFDARRENIEGAIGISGELGSGWRFDAHFSHGQIENSQRFFNSPITANFQRALNAVNSGGQIVCAVNADGNAANDDPACVPFNPFGQGAPSQAAIDYVTGTQMTDSVNKLDSLAASVQGEPFSLWAGPVSIVLGVEARWQEQEQTIGALNAAGAFGTNVFSSALNGGTDVKEGFGEILLPLFNSENFEFDLNGAARYSDYNLSGGIWSWKVGGTARLFQDILLRATRSRDIRAPSIGNLFSVSAINIRNVVDNDTEGRTGTPGYNPTPRATIFTGGNPDLVPEVARTWTAGLSVSPFDGFNLSVDYYDIEIGNAITAPNASDITAACAQGVTSACDAVIRDATGTITTVYATTQNIAQFATNGVDIEASYVTPLSWLADIPGVLRVRALATYVDELSFQTGFNQRQVAGDVGDTVLDGVPHWRGNLSLTYQSDDLGLDARLRYVGGGQYDSTLPIVNNDIDARTYLDLGAQFKVEDLFTFFMNVNNVFDVAPPLIIQTTNVHYDNVGRYYTVGARVEF